VYKTLSDLKNISSTVKSINFMYQIK